MSKGTWNSGVMKFIKREKTSHYASHGKEIQETMEWQKHSGSCTPTTGSASRDNITT